MYVVYCYAEQCGKVLNTTNLSELIGWSTKKVQKVLKRLVGLGEFRYENGEEL